VTIVVSLGKILWYIIVMIELGSNTHMVPTTIIVFGVILTSLGVPFSGACMRYRARHSRFQCLFSVLNWVLWAIC